MRKKPKTRKKLGRIAVASILLAVLSAAAFFYFPKSSEPSEEQIIERISKFDLPQERPWITKIENAEEQARLYPALFNGTKDGQYALRYGTLFAVYDYRDDKIVKEIPILRIRIGE